MAERCTPPRNRIPSRDVAPPAAPASEPEIAEPPPPTDAWWLRRAAQATFTGRRIALPESCARVLADARDPHVTVEFNGSTFEGAALAPNQELDLGDALAQEMSEVLDEEDGLEIFLVPGRGRPTLAIHPFLIATR